MGSKPSTLNRVLSRSTTDSGSSSRREKDFYKRQYRNNISSPISSFPINTQIQQQPLDRSLSQHSTDIPEGTTTQPSSVVSSKSNLSSFLSSLRNGKSKELVSQNDSSSQINVSSSNDHREGEPGQLDDLREQKLQKKKNKQQQKMKEQAKKQQRKQKKHQQQHQQQQLQQKPSPYQQHSAASTGTTLVPPSSPPSMHSLTLASPSRAVDPLDDRHASSPSLSTSIAQSTDGPVASASGVSLSFLSSFRRGNIRGDREQTRTPTLPSSSPSLSSFATALSINGTTEPSQAQLPTPPNGTTTLLPSSKRNFIRGKAGFAWLEKRLTPLATDQEDEKNLNDSNWAYQQGQLNEMEIEAAKGYVDRITDQHYLMKDVFGGNYHTPMDLAFKRVFENGCGAGDWSLDMASEMPETDFVGGPQIMFTTSNQEKQTPIIRPRGLLGADQSQQGSSPSAPTTLPSPSLAPTATGSIAASSLSTSTSTANTTPANNNIRPNIKPRNCTFNPDVPLNRLPFPNEQFDFVYQRRQSVVLMSTEWQRTILELFRILKRGGWVQIVEPDLFLRGGGELCQLAGEYCVGIFEAMGRNPNVIHEMPHLLEAAGFVNISVKVFSIPLGWGGVVGQAMLVNQKGFVNELEPIYVRQGHGDSDEYRELTKSIFEEAVEQKAYINYHVVVGQKPASASERLLHQQMQKQKGEEQQRMMEQESIRQQQLLEQQLLEQLALEQLALEQQALEQQALEQQDLEQQALEQQQPQQLQQQQQHELPTILLDQTQVQDETTAS
ncbi:hypothetical protein BGZ59_009611 [Podila verticillata]|nr:hypothetical protein BGZ59_009611 [Podila verticillata]KFH67584.1 hypothetical protein MVEG_06316 [Podila verticillata NRRL 6337]